MTETVSQEAIRHLIENAGWTEQRAEQFLRDFRKFEQTALLISQRRKEERPKCWTHY